MQYHIFWSSKALEDLDEVYDFYVTKSILVAVRVYNGILDEVSILVRHPYIAQVEKLLENCKKPYRSLVVLKGRFKIIYSVEEDRINVARIWSCRRNPKVYLQYHVWPHIFKEVD